MNIVCGSLRILVWSAYLLFRVCLSACINAATNGRNFLNFDIGCVYEKFDEKIKNFFF